MVKSSLSTPVQLGSMIACETCWSIIVMVKLATTVQGKAVIVGTTSFHYTWVLCKVLLVWETGCSLKLWLLPGVPEDNRKSGQTEHLDRCDWTSGHIWLPRVSLSPKPGGFHMATRQNRKVHSLCLQTHLNTGSNPRDWVQAVLVGQKGQKMSNKNNLAIPGPTPNTKP